MGQSMVVVSYSNRFDAKGVTGPSPWLAKAIYPALAKSHKECRSLSQITYRQINPIKALSDNPGKLQVGSIDMTNISEKLSRRIRFYNDNP
ncbi:MAG: hypothetical protein HQL69_20245 [Magnetococcales bacterium]|nr:hypothetical protein [Magnetococcales bacterium]